MMFRGIVKGMAKKQVLNEISTRIKQLSRQDIMDWVSGKRSILDFAQSEYVDMIKRHKDLAIEALDTITIEEIRNACTIGKPECKDIFESPQFEKRVREELANGRRFVNSL